MSSRVVAVLGMHRSGTSWLTGALEEMGLALGEVSTSAPHNKKGNRESRPLRQLHESVLRDNDGSWRAPNWPNEWSRKQRKQLGRYIASMNDSFELWGFKDPRALMVLDEWKRQLPELERVGVYRHPTAVYRSLHARHPDFTEDEAIGLWVTYNARLIAEHAERPFALIRFDVDDDELHAQAAAAGRALNLPGVGERDTFFDPALVHNAESRPVPDAARDVWEALERIRAEVAV